MGALTAIEGLFPDSQNVPPPSSSVMLQINKAVTLFYLSQFMRTYCPDVPYTVTSTLRTSAQNASDGGASNSAHLAGLAVDFVFPGASDEDSLTLFNSMIKPNWPGSGFCEWDTDGTAPHVHVNLSRYLTYWIQGALAVGGMAMVWAVLTVVMSNKKKKRKKNAKT